MKSAAFLLLAMLVFPTYANSGWLINVGGLSWHATSHPRNEVNPGVGIERRFNSEWAAGAGYYRNSWWRDSYYANVTYTPWSLGPVHFGAMGGLVSGYQFKSDAPSKLCMRDGDSSCTKGGLTPAAALVAEWRHKYGAVQFQAVPPIPGSTKGIAAVTFKIAF